jgi:hypothetical protein
VSRPKRSSSPSERRGFAGSEFPVPDVLPATPEHRLFRLLDRDDPRRAHSRYNALIRRLVSYEHARERERGARARSPANFGV